MWTNSTKQPIFSSFKSIGIPNASPTSRLLVGEVSECLQQRSSSTSWFISGPRSWRNRRAPVYNTRLLLLFLQVVSRLCNLVGSTSRIASNSMKSTFNLVRSRHVFIAIYTLLLESRQRHLLLLLLHSESESIECSQYATMQPNNLLLL